MRMIQVSTKEIPQLVDIRIDFLRMLGRLEPQEEQPMRLQQQQFFSEMIHSGELIALLGEQHNTITSSAILQLYRRAPNQRTPTGRFGLLYGIFTYPDHRGKGHASKLIGKLIQTSRELKLDCIDIMATEAGQPVYEKLGFQLLPDAAMWLPLE